MVIQYHQRPYGLIEEDYDFVAVASAVTIPLSHTISNILVGRESHNVHMSRMFQAIVRDNHSIELCSSQPKTRGLAVSICVTVICILFCVCDCVCVFSVFFMFLCYFPLQLSPLVL